MMKAIDIAYEAEKNKAKLIAIKSFLDGNDSDKIKVQCIKRALSDWAN